MIFRFRPTSLLEGAKSFEVLKASPFQSPSSRFLHRLRSTTANQSSPATSFSFAQIPVLSGSETKSALSFVFQRQIRKMTTFAVEERGKINSSDYRVFYKDNKGELL